MTEFAWDPESYQALMAEEVPSYPRLQDELAAAAADGRPQTILDLGIGSGLTAAKVAQALPRAHILGIDDSAEMLTAAKAALDPEATDLRRGRLEDPLPKGPFDLVMSTLAVHHLDGEGKAELFSRIASVLTEGGRFVLADIIVPSDPTDVVTPIDGIDDTPSTVDEQLGWLDAAGLRARVQWQHRDLAVIIATKVSQI